MIGLAAALSINGVLLSLMAQRGREIGWSARPEPGVVLRLELSREPPRRAETATATAPATASVRSNGSEGGPDTKRAQPLRPLSSLAAAQTGSPAAPASPSHGAPAGSVAAPSPQGAKPGGAQDAGAGEADLRARTALALRKLGACSRVNSGAGDAQDKALCIADLAPGHGAGLDSIAADKRAGYDAAHARAGYLVPADAADPDFVVSGFRRGGTVVKGHAGCDLEDGKWQCFAH